MIFGKKKKEAIPTPQAVLYTSCDTLPLANFERCETEGDLKALQEDERQPCNEALLQEKWRQIRGEYADQSANESFNEYVLMKYRHLELCGKVAGTQKILGLLREYYIPELVAHLRHIGYDESKGYAYYDNDSIDEYLRDLNRIETTLADDEIQINDLAARLAEYEAQQKESGKKLKRGHFDEQLAHISKYMGIALNKQIITVTQYNTYLKQANAHYKHLNSKQNQEHGG